MGGKICEKIFLEICGEKYPVKIKKILGISRKNSAFSMDKSGGTMYTIGVRIAV